MATGSSGGSWSHPEHAATGRQWEDVKLLTGRSGEGGNALEGAWLCQPGIAPPPPLQQGQALSRGVTRHPPPPRTETWSVLFKEGKHTSAQEKPRQRYHRRLSALQRQTDPWRGGARRRTVRPSPPLSYPSVHLRGSGPSPAHKLMGSSDGDPLRSPLRSVPLCFAPPIPRKGSRVLRLRCESSGLHLLPHAITAPINTVVTAAVGCTAPTCSRTRTCTREGGGVAAAINRGSN